MSAVPPMLPYTEEAITQALSPGVFSRPLRFFPMVDSTNERAAELARAGAPEGTTVVADAQSSGRGRGDRRWESPPGMGIYLSVVVRPPLDAERATFITSVAALSACAAASDEADAACGIKWPNDVLLGGGKVAGILAERGGSGAHAWVVVGIGVNVNYRRDDFPPPLRGKATSILLETGRAHCRVRLAARLLEAFEADYRVLLGEGPWPLLERLRDASAILGHRVEIEDGARRVQGIALDFDERGGLVLGKGKGREAFYTGSIARVW